MRYDGMLYGYVLREEKKKVTMRATTRIYLRGDNFLVVRHSET